MWPCLPSLRPTLPDERRQGDRAKSKLESGDDFLFLPEVVDAACLNLAEFWQLPRTSVNEDMIMHRSPFLGIAGKSHPDLVVRDYGEIDRERCERERLHKSGACWNNEPASEEHNAQVAKLVGA